MSLVTYPENSMPLNGKDREVVQLLARFRQATAKHINELVFHDRASATPCDRSIRRLMRGGYLHRIERRTVGGAKGGSGQYVYALGRRGFFLHFTGRYNPARNVNYHALAVLDAFCEVRRLGRELAGWSAEPDCWQVVGNIQLKPDLYVDFGGVNKYWLEIDLGTEAQRQLRSKLEAYWRAYNEADGATMMVFPKVIWLAVDEERRRELVWLIEQGPADAVRLFDVVTAGQLSTVI